jgi:hypothetical protein
MNVVNLFEILKRSITPQGEAAAIRRLRGRSAQRIVAVGPVIGIVGDSNIYEWVENGRGQRLKFAAVWKPSDPGPDEGKIVLRFPGQLGGASAGLVYALTECQG